MSKTDYTAPIRGIGKLILKLLTQLGGLFLNRIQDVEVRSMATGLLQGAEKTVDVLSDTDPNDKEQIQSVVNELFNDGPFKQGVQAEILEKVQNITNPHVKTALTILTGHSFPIADKLTDEDDANTEQVKEYLITQLQSHDGVDLFNALLSIILPPTYADTLTVIIIQAILNWIEENPEAAPKVDTKAKLQAMMVTYEKKIAA